MARTNWYRPPSRLKLQWLRQFEINELIVKQRNETFKKLFARSSTADVSINVGSATVKVHKIVLCARSEVFTTMFSLPLSESSSNQITIVDFPIEAVEAFVRYLYTDSFEINLNIDLCVQVILMARKYDVSNLKSDCESYLCSVIKNTDDVGSLVTCYLMADKHSYTAIKYAVLNRMTILSALTATYVKDDLPKREEDEEDEEETKPRQETTYISTDSGLATNRILFDSVGADRYMVICQHAIAKCQLLCLKELENY